MEKIICIWGDSITWGAYDEESGGWVERLKKHFWNDENFSMVYGLGIDADTTQGLLKRFDAEASNRKPDIIIFAIGVNDSIYRFSDKKQETEITVFGDNIQKLIEKARLYTEKITFIGLTRVDEIKTKPIPWSKSGKCYANKNIEKHNEVIYSVCKKEKIKFIDIFDLLTKEDLDDGLHPNSQGHKKIFEEVVKSLD